MARRPPNSKKSGHPHTSKQPHLDIWTLDFWKQLHTKYGKGWRGGILINSTTIGIVFAINFLFLTFVGVFPRFRQNNAILYEGECATARKVSSAIHIVINICASALVGGSNHCMQILSAPTRFDLDEAHERRIWLDIGVPSIRNLWYFKNRWRFLMWALLGLSSLPVHVFYNSVVFSSISLDEYWIFAVTEPFVQNASITSIPWENWAANNSEDTINSENTITNASVKDFFENISQAMQKMAVEQRMARLEPSDCISAYGHDVQPEHGNLILVTSSESTTEGPSDLIQHISLSRNTLNTDGYGSFGWICENPRYKNKCLGDDLQSAIIHAENRSWSPFGKRVDYCLSQPSTQRCRIYVSLPFLVVVLAMNAVKFTVLLVVTRYMTADPLLTMGDAISSFLKRPDIHTKGMCLVSQKDFQEIDLSRPAWARLQNFPRQDWVPQARLAVLQKKLWASAPRKRRWILCSLLYAVGISTCITLLACSAGIPKINFRHLLNTTLGTITYETSIMAWESRFSLPTLIMIANSPQLILTFIYFTYNGLFTCMTMAFEWNQLSVQRKSLRVSGVPEGKQRSTYFLQLPLRIALPLLSASTVLHWLVSQSLYIINLESHGLPSFRDQEESPRWIEGDGDPIRTDVDIFHTDITCGYSPIAMLGVAVMGIIIVFALLGAARIRLKATGQPVAGSCSAAISAACHTIDSEDRHASLKEVQWGVLKVHNGLGHCGFSSLELMSVEPGVLYSGEIGHEGMQVAL